MPIEGFVEYRRREYCNEIRCPVQMLMNSKEGTEDYERLREICREKCIHTTYQFHHWLIEKGYLLVRPGNDSKKEGLK